MTSKDYIKKQIITEEENILILNGPTIKRNLEKVKNWKNKKKYFDYSPLTEYDKQWQFEDCGMKNSIPLGFPFAENLEIITNN